MTDSSDIERRIVEIYGTDLRGDHGVIHVTSVWAESARNLVALHIGSETPRSETDDFVLNVARARADAIVTTGKVLRDEKELTHDFRGDNDLRKAFAGWRKEHLLKPEPPISLILTSGRDLDWEHPLFGCGTLPMVFTSQDGGELIRESAVRRGVDVVSRPEPSLRDAIAYLREMHGAENIVIETGLSTSRSLYETPVLLNELMLSIYSGSRLPKSAKGKHFSSVPQLGLVFPLAGSTFQSDEESGRWIFRRFTR
jgi:riboflavin biosynthesis pyrimidine reductase